MTCITETVIGLAYYKNLYGKLILRVKLHCLEWDLKTGNDIGKPYIKYRDATEEDIVRFKRRKG